MSSKFKNTKHTSALHNIFKINYLLLFLVAVIFIQIFSMFIPYLTGKVLITNDYINISETTKLRERYFDNTEFIQKECLRHSGSGAKTFTLATGMSGGGYANSNLSKTFFSANRHEFAWQSQCGWLMHHQNTLLSPINQFYLGKQLSRISQQYGSLTTAFLTFLIKLSGGLTFDNYFKVLYFFYPFYYLLFFIVSAYLLRDSKYLLLVAVLSASFLFKLSYVSIYLAPGFNPIRQLPSLLVLFFLMLYLRKRKTSSFFLMLAFSILAVINNKEFGFFAVAAATISLFLENFLEKIPLGRGKFFFLTATFLISVYLFFFIHMGSNPLEKYYFVGISGPIIDKFILKLILIIFSLVYFLIYRLLRRDSGLKYIAVFLFFYIQGILLYYIWDPAPNHLFSISSPLALLPVILLKLILDGWQRDINRNLVIVPLVLCLFSFLYLPSWRGYNKEKAIYQKISADHKIYSWDLARARIKTTMNPEYFINAVNLIQKYSKNSNGIYIISQYDNFLPFLARKYSAMPFDEVAISLLTSREVNDCINKILNDKPEYIFIDTGIEEGIYDKDKNKILAYLSAHYDFSNKIKMWHELKKVYMGVKDSYRLIEKSDIISVYKKK